MIGLSCYEACLGLLKGIFRIRLLRVSQELNHLSRSMPGRYEYSAVEEDLYRACLSKEGSPTRNFDTVNLSKAYGAKPISSSMQILCSFFWPWLIWPCVSAEAVGVDVENS